MTVLIENPEAQQALAEAKSTMQMQDEAIRELSAELERVKAERDEACRSTNHNAELVLAQQRRAEQAEQRATAAEKDVAERQQTLDDIAKALGSDPVEWNVLADHVEGVLEEKKLAEEQRERAEDDATSAIQRATAAEARERALRETLEQARVAVEHAANRPHEHNPPADWMPSPCEVLERAQAAIAAALTPPAAEGTTPTGRVEQDEVPGGWGIVEDGVDCTCTFRLAGWEDEIHQTECAIEKHRAEKHPAAEGRETAIEARLGDAYDRGHRDARMEIDRILGDVGKGSMGDLSVAIRKLLRRAAMGHAYEPGHYGDLCGASVETPEGSRRCLIAREHHTSPAQPSASGDGVDPDRGSAPTSGRCLGSKPIGVPSKAPASLPPALGVATAQAGRVAEGAAIAAGSPPPAEQPEGAILGSPYSVAAIRADRSEADSLRARVATLEEQVEQAVVQKNREHAACSRLLGRATQAEARVAQLEEALRRIDNGGCIEGGDERDFCLTMHPDHGLCSSCEAFRALATPPSVSTKEGR